MEINRRAFASALAAAGVLPAFSATRARANTHGARFLASVSAPDGADAFAGFAADGDLVFRHALPGRGHGVTLHPQRPESVIIARRPGTFMLAVDLSTGAIVQTLESPPGRHFYGHAAYSADGATLFATENDYDNAAGAIGVYDAAGPYRRVGEWPGLEIGPHELALMPDGRTLAVAIGGIQTHPAQGREKLNLEVMQPALAYFDTIDGRMLFRTALPATLHQLSIRHLDIAADGRTALCMQYEGPKRDRVPIAAVQSGDGPIQILDLPDHVASRTQNYAGSVRFDRSGCVVAATCPRGNMAVFWDLTEAGRFLGRVAIFDGCGLTALEQPGCFAIASGAGGLTVVDALAPDGPEPRAHIGGGSDTVSWDNHMTLANR